MLRDQTVRTRNTPHATAVARGLLLALVGLALALPAQAQAPADSARRTVAIPAPEGPGVIYFRAGERPVRRIRRVAPPAAARATTEPSTALAQRAARAPSGVSRLDLVLLEQSLLRAIDARLAAFDRTRSTAPMAPQRQAPVIVLPGAPAAPAAPATPDPAPTAADPLPEPPAAPPPATSEPLVTEIERAILDTGLFRTTRVHFEFGEAGILPVSQATLDAVAEVLRRYPGLQIRVGGHTDAVSSDAYNLALSQRRADAVRDALIGAGVAAGRVQAVGFGEAEPVASNETETGRALNRRVEFAVLNPEAAETERRTVSPRTIGDILREELERLREDGR